MTRSCNMLRIEIHQFTMHISYQHSTFYVSYYSYCRSLLNVLPTFYICFLNSSGSCLFLYCPITHKHWWKHITWNSPFPGKYLSLSDNTSPLPKTTAVDPLMQQLKPKAIEAMDNVCNWRICYWQKWVYTIEFIKPVEFCSIFMSTINLSATQQHSNSK